MPDTGSSSTPVRERRGYGAVPPPSGQRNSSYRGVRRRRYGRWVSEIRLPNSRQRIWLGSFDTPEKAARAFDAALVCLRGPAVAAAHGLNFPSSPPAAMGRRTNDSREVRAAAVMHANRVAAAAPEPVAADDPTTARGGGLVLVEQQRVTAPAPLQVSAAAARLDWSQLLANPPPLYSPTTVTGSHAYMQRTSPTAAPPDDDDRPFAGLWSFDSGGSCSRH